jgi:signal transduction histidine kinase
MSPTRAIGGANALRAPWRAGARAAPPMADEERREPPGRIARWRWPGLLAAIALGTTVTVLVAAVPSLRFGPQRPALHVQIATAAALVALLVALLAAGRYRRRPVLGDLLLAAALAVLGSANLLSSTIQAASGRSPDGLIAWLPASGRLVAAALLAGAALASVRTLARPLATARAVAVASVAAVALLALILAALDPELPPAIGVDAPARDAGYGLLAGSTASTVLKGTSLALIAVAAVGFTVRGRRRTDPLSLLLTWGMTLLAFAWLNYLLVPSLYVNWFYAGDVLALAAYVVLAAGAVSEIRAYQSDRERLAAIEERGRVARELHDGVAQEVLHVLAQARRLRAERPGPETERMLQSAERALDESRSAISALRAPLDEPLPAALERIGAELGRRLQLDVHVRADAAVAVTAKTAEALLRIVGEALVNAARHGGARIAVVELRDGAPARLLVRDDGCGFDPDPACIPDGAFGLVSMRERAAAVGGVLTIRSRPRDRGAGADAGTAIEVVLP